MSHIPSKAMRHATATPRPTADEARGSRSAGGAIALAVVAAGVLLSIPLFRAARARPA